MGAQNASSCQRLELGNGSEFSELWGEQLRFNEDVKSAVTEKVDWPINFILGLHSETDELLRELHWRYHRNQSREKVCRENIAEELADITKYLICLWQELGFTLPEFYEAIRVKSEIMAQRLHQEFAPPPDPDRLVVISDLDGTLADFRRGLEGWLDERELIQRCFIVEEKVTLYMDVDLQIPYGKFRDLKAEFEGSGGYRSLPSYPERIDFLKFLVRDLGAYLIITTARPTQNKRIWFDTWNWLKGEGITPDQLLFTETDRIIATITRQGDSQWKNKTILLEDNPEIIRRALPSLRVLMAPQPYNSHLILSDRLQKEWVLTSLKILEIV